MSAGDVFPLSWSVLAEAYGGPKGLADHLRVHYTTVYRWARGGEMNRWTKELVREAAREAGVLAPV